MLYKIENGLVVIPDKPELFDRYKLKNPKRIQLQRLNKFAYHIPEYVEFAEKRPGGVAVPLCCWRERPQVADTRAKWPPPVLGAIESREAQGRAVTVMLDKPDGILEAPAGTGKTTIMLMVAGARGCRTVVIVPTIDIKKQWEKRAETLFGPGAPVEVSTFQTAAKLPAGWFADFGMIIIDECHRVACDSIRDVLAKCPAYYRYGTSATPERSDGLTPALTWLLGGVRHSIPREESGTLPVKYKTVWSKCTFIVNDNNDLQAQIASSSDRDVLMQGRKRDELIKELVGELLESNHSVLVLGLRVEHLDRMAAGRNDAAMIHGKTPKKERAEILDKVRAGQIPVLFATYNLASEGLDCPILSALIMAAPIGNKNRIIQSCGRIARPYPGKPDPVVYDLVDGGGLCAVNAKKRLKVYRDLGMGEVKQ